MPRSRRVSIAGYPHHIVHRGHNRDPVFLENADRRIYLTALPLAWIAVVTTTAAFQKITSANPKIGFFAAANDLAMKLGSGLLPPEKAAVAPQLIFNQRLDGWITLFFTLILWFVILDMVRVAIRSVRGLSVPPSAEVAA